MGNYQFDIIYRPGTSNLDADAMSRLPEIMIEKDQQTQIPSESVKAVCNMSINTHSYIKHLNFSSQVIDDVENVIQGQEVAGVSKEELRDAQKRDPVLSRWMKNIIDSKKPARNELPMTPEHTTMYRTFDYFCMEGGFVFREVTINDEKRKQLFCHWNTGRWL